MFSRMQRRSHISQIVKTMEEHFNAEMKTHKAVANLNFKNKFTVMFSSCMPLSTMSQKYGSGRRIRYRLSEVTGHNFLKKSRVNTLFHVIIHRALDELEKLEGAFYYEFPLDIFLGDNQHFLVLTRNTAYLWKKSEQLPVLDAKQWQQMFDSLESKGTKILDSMDHSNS